MQDENPQYRLLRTGNYAGLKFEEGWLFVHILESEFIELKPWILPNENNNRQEISAQTAGDTTDEFEDASGRDLITPRNNERNLIFQNFVGVAPSRVQLYPLYGRDGTPNLAGGAEPGNPQVPITGYDSPYNNPSTQAEVFTVEGISPFKLQAYNPMDEPVEARVSFHVNKLKYAVIDDTQKMVGFLQGQLPVRTHEMGLGVQTNDQVRAPSWMMDKFGDAIYTTEEILNEADTPTGANTPQLGDGVVSQ